MRHYNISYIKRGEQITTPLTSKQNAVLKYLTLITIQSGANVYSELKILKHLKNGKIIDITTQTNKYLKG